jgi:hypothetical protein
MPVISKSLIVGAVAAVGLVAVGDLALGHNRGDARQELGMSRAAVFALLPQTASIAPFEERWQAGFPAGSRVAVAAASQERPAAQTATASDCGRQAWPYVSRDCLIAGEGSAPRRPVRTISLDRVERSGVERR